MSVQARQAVVSSPNTFFQAGTQRSDLLNANLTDSNLIALIQHLLADGHIIEFTAIRTDHHDDGPKGHAGGLAFDCWPLSSPQAGTYLDQSQQGFKAFLQSIAAFQGLYQLGLAGTADTQYNKDITHLGQDFSDDPCVFSDGGADHIHAGCHPA